MDVAERDGYMKVPSAFVNRYSYSKIFSINLDCLITVGVSRYEDA